MNATNVSAPQNGTGEWIISERGEFQIRQQVKHLFEAAESNAVEDERRLDKRTPFPHLITLTPISDKDLCPLGDPIDVVGKCLAERGLTFFHTANLPFRRAIVSFEIPTAHLILNISWSRFLRPGWYDSGGRFTHVVQESGKLDSIGN